MKSNSNKLSALIFMILVLGLQFHAIAQADNSNIIIDYSIWNNLLQKHVNDKGEVDYKGFKHNKSELKKFTDQFSKLTPQESWTGNEKKAYLINAYNAFTIQLILNNFPLESIKDIGDEPFAAFKKDFINLGGKMVSLDDIEKGMLVPMGDPRVHFAVNCASFSCPKLDNKVYKPNSLDKQLDEAASEFINSDLNTITTNVVKLSQIFKWYKGDFESESQNFIDFINKYSKTKIDSNAKIEFLEYNWSLNSK